MVVTDGPTERTQDKNRNDFNVTYGRNVVDFQMLELSLFGTGTAIRLERDA